MKKILLAATAMTAIGTLAMASVPGATGTEAPAQFRSAGTAMMVAEANLSQNQLRTRENEDMAQGTATRDRNGEDVGDGMSGGAAAGTGAGAGNDDQGGMGSGGDDSGAAAGNGGNGGSDHGGAGEGHGGEGHGGEGNGEGGHGGDD